MGVVRGALFIIGTSIGAGFLSGAELVRFFHTEGFFLPVIFSSLVFCAFCSLYLYLGNRHGGFSGTLKALFGRAGNAAKFAVSVSSFIPCAGMLAGLDALVPSVKPLLSVCGLAFVFLCLKRGMKGISLLNTVLVPLLLALIFVFGFRVRMPFCAARGIAPFLGGTLYAFMNVFLAAPVLMDAGKEMKRPVLPAVIASAVVAVAAICILGRVYGTGDGAIGAEMPFLAVMKGRKIFFVAAALAIVTSLASAMYPLLALCDAAEDGKKHAAKGFVLLAAFALSRLGLSGIVRWLYPLLGIMGGLLSAFCIFYEYFFEKHHEKIHSRGEDAQDTGRAHDEIEFKHLPAVDNEVSETRSGNDVFSHDRTDPRHSDIDFQHRDKRGACGRDHEFPQNLEFRCAHRAHQQDLIFVCGKESGEHVHRRHDDAHEYRHKNNRFASRAEPNDDQGPERDFG